MVGVADAAKPKRGPSPTSLNRTTRTIDAAFNGLQPDTKVLDAQLKTRKFVAGDTLTLADFALGAPLNYATQAGFPLEDYAEIRRWHAGLMALPAWQKTVAESAPRPVGAAAAA